MSFANAWCLWWELNREHLLGLRKTLPQRAPATVGGVDPRAAYRTRVLPVLRRVALKAASPDLRAAALRALGRIGEDEDVRSFLALLRAGRQPPEVLEGAALGLASVERIRYPGLRSEVRDFFDRLLAGGHPLTDRRRHIAILAVSLRARDDPALARSLGLRCKRPVTSAAEASALLYACGLTQDEMLALELRKAARKGTLGARKLHDVSRSHATLGLALTGEAGALSALTDLLRSDDLGANTRRSAVLGLGILLRSAVEDAEARGKAERAILAVFSKCRDPLAQGFAAMAMGTAHQPFGVPALEKVVDKTGGAVVKPFAALALGLAARRLPEKPRDRVRKFLVRELTKTRNIHLAGALSIAVGLADAREARGLLLQRAGQGRKFTGIRTNAIEALGIMGGDDPAVTAALHEALADRSPMVVQSAAVALGFAGNPKSAKLLVATLAEAPWEAVQIHMVVGLSHLGGTVAIEPLLELLRDPAAKPTVRSSAATVLGILLDPRERDPLFEIDACCNPYGLTRATRELVRVY